MKQELREAIKREHAHADSIAGTAVVIAAGALASALQGGFDECAENGRPLSQVQKITMLGTALLAFDGVRADTASSLRIDAALARVGRERNTT